MMESILIGTRGWDHPEWAPTFYPEELPPEWRFCYYSNYLRSVLVPAATLDSVVTVDAREWAQDSDPEFRFLLELPQVIGEAPSASVARALFNELLAVIAPIVPQTAGVVLRMISAAAVRRLPDLLTALAGIPVCTDLPPEWRDARTLACLREHQSGLCWRPEQEAEPHPGGRLLVTFSHEATPRGQRRVLEMLADWQREDSIVAVVFETAEQAKQGRILAELMNV